jgi:hypothetical protein
MAVELAIILAWSIGSSASIAVLGALGGLLADATSPRTAIGVAGLVTTAIAVRRTAYSRTMKTQLFRRRVRGYR